ncbi:tyrosine-type recombinase/integrase [Fundidesulfovibrio agrisoli]|uniref:tyrosine-type recombinase/integrase n=1 Tax=Fundidesulfovibrio agrisoli TaxID=2922717 RepID=UPI001FACDAC6|nr:site-specific integrase [Fundidesulfovibrio agrisoli]
MGYIKSKFPGVRYREHPTRKHGVKPDRYFFIRYKLNGKDKEEALGWASEGMTEAKASARLAELKEAKRTGKGAVTLAEQRAEADAARAARQEEEIEAARAGVTVAQAWERYYPLTKTNKAARTCAKEEQVWRLWISPVIGAKPLKDVAPIHLERIKRNVLDAGRAPRSAAYVLAVIRQLFNFARDHDLFSGTSPAAKVSAPKADNRRTRFLTAEEAEQLLTALKKRSLGVHDMALLSLYAGLRAGEVFSLAWPDVDFDCGVLTLRDTKSGKTRQVPMTDAVRAMLSERKPAANGNPLVFPSETGVKVGQISQTFTKVVSDLGLNDEIVDSRQKVVFHTLRHTFASWLVQNGVPLITVGRLLGHSTTAMTERYSHLAPDHFKQALDTLESHKKQATKKPGQLVQG